MFFYSKNWKPFLKPKQQTEFRYRLIIALSTSQKFHAKNFDSSLLRNDIGELIGEAPVAENEKVDLECFIADRPQNQILNFLLYATVRLSARPKLQSSR